MSRVIHARRIRGKLRYRVWETIVDAYLTPEMTEAKVRSWILEDALARARATHAREIDGRIARAQAKGTSALDRGSDGLDASWETECCTECGCFHHAFRGSASRCDVCGEPQGDVAHGPACVAKKGSKDENVR